MPSPHPQTQVEYLLVLVEYLHLVTIAQAAHVNPKLGIQHGDATWGFFVQASMRPPNSREQVIKILIVCAGVGPASGDDQPQAHLGSWSHVVVVLRMVVYPHSISINQYPAGEGMDIYFFGGLGSRSSSEIRVYRFFSFLFFPFFLSLLWMRGWSSLEGHFVTDIAKGGRYPYVVAPLWRVGYYIHNSIRNIHIYKGIMLYVISVYMLYPTAVLLPRMHD